MIINQLDLGSSHPWASPSTGQELGSYLIQGLEYAVWPMGSVVRSQRVNFNLVAWQALGGASAQTRQATLYLLKQVEELASSRDQQPCYIQWNATAQPNAPLNASELHDGWYILTDFSPVYMKYVVAGIVQCSITATQVSAAPPRQHAISYLGGALSTNFSGQATNLVSLPLGATAVEANFNRTTAEGAIPCILSPAASPETFVPSATVSNWYKGGVHVYDTINTSSNPVPVAGGTFVNTNWVEVFFSDHNFVGDCVVTNGLQLLLFQAGQAQIATCYLWNPALATANWQQYATLNSRDSSTNQGTLRAYTLTRVGQDESSLVVFSSTSTPQSVRVSIRLQRGRYEVRSDLTPLTEAPALNYSLNLTLIAAPKIIYNSGSSGPTDVTLAEGSPPPGTDYAYGAAFIANSADPFIAGFLLQGTAGGALPFDGGASALVGLGDNNSLAINATKAYGFFALPYGVSGSYSTATLQAEAESGTLGTGWSSVADAAASAGNAAKCASGTLINGTATWGTAFVPDPGKYDLWVRIKVTSAASATPQMKVGLFDSTTSGFVTSTTFAPNQVTTGYAWYRVAAAVTPNPTDNMRVRAITTATTNTDWFMDESALVPLTLTSDHRGPQELWQQFAYDRSARTIQL